MTIASEITRIQGNISAAYTACNNKGATMPATQNSDNLADCINSIIVGSFYATLTVTTNSGATVSVAGQTQIAENGEATFYIYSPDLYTLTCSLDGETKQKDIDITDAITYTTTLYVTSTIPAEYQELTYIQSNGTGYFDTGFAFTSNYAKVSLEIMFTAQDTGGKNLFGSSTNNDSSWFGIYMQGPTQAGFYCGNSNPWYYIFNRNERISLSFDRQGYTLEIDNNGSTSNYSVGGTIVCGNNLLIASQPPLGTSRTPLGVRYYTFTVEQDGEVKRKYTPVKRKSDNKVGLWDEILKEFNAPVTGTFDAGDEV